MTKKPTKTEELEQKVAELTLDLQRTRADFENYRKRVDSERENARSVGKSQEILKLLPVIDNIERAIAHVPDELRDNTWVQAVAGLAKQLDKSLDGLELTRIDAKQGDTFDPELHEAVMMEEGDGDTEVVSEELQAGYKLGGSVIRHAMVKVSRK